MYLYTVQIQLDKTQDSTFLFSKLKLHYLFTCHSLLSFRQNSTQLNTFPLYQIEMTAG